MMKKTKLIAVTGVLSALAILLYFLEFPLAFLFPAYLKLDLSDVPAVLGAIAIGPIAGIAIELVKNIIHLLILGVNTPFGSGEIGNFFAGIGLVLPIAIIIRSTRKNSLVPYIIGAACMVLIANIINYFVTLPLFGIPADARWSTILSALLPFNLVKAVVVSILTAGLYSRLKTVFEKMR